ncbi:DUF1254 domain-containing protein [Pirellulaceae bacterium SH467]
MKNIFAILFVTASLIPSFTPATFSSENSPGEPFTATCTHPNNRDQVLSRFDQLTQKAYFWGWPLVYLTNVQRAASLIQRPGISGGAPVAPVNRLSMLTEPVSPEFRSVPCPNPDVIYGFSILDLSEDAVVLQVPDLTDRFWLVQLGDHRTDSFGELGSMYGSKPGFYMIVGPNWKGVAPPSIVEVFQSPTSLAYLIPRVLTRSKEEVLSVQDALSEFSVSPLTRWNGEWKKRDWTKRKWYPALGESTRSRCKSVNPMTFFDDLSSILDSVPPLEGEESFYKEIRSLLQAAQQSDSLKEKLRTRARELESSLIEPLFDFSRVGAPLPTGWTSVSNGAAFGTDFMTRAAVAKSNIFVNRANEAKYFYLEADGQGQSLQGERDYTITFPKGALPPNQGFWSLTAYNSDHRIAPVENAPYALLGTQDKLSYSADGSVTISISQRKTSSDTENWIAPPRGRFILYLRIYAPAKPVQTGAWHPPSVAVESSASRQGFLVSATQDEVPMDAR